MNSIKQRRPDPSISSSSVKIIQTEQQQPPIIYRGQVAMAHDENIYNLQRQSIPWFWITASLSVTLFPLTLVLGEFILLRLPSTKTKDPFPISNYGHFRQGARLGAGAGLILMIFFVFFFRVVLAPPAENSHLRESSSSSSSSSTFISTFVAAILSVSGAFAIFKLIIEKALKNAPKLSFAGGGDADEDGSDGDGDVAHHGNVSSIKPADSSSSSSGEIISGPSLLPSLRPTSNCVDSPSTMLETTAEEVKQIEETHRKGVEQMTVVTIFGSMLTLIVSAAVGVTWLIRTLQITG